MQKMETDKKKYSDQHTEEFYVDSTLVGIIIGKGGSVIKDI
jgi:hypothetical protein